jgi:ketosteroid isomerase-like protein
VSQHNVELQRRLTEAFNARNIETFIALCDPKIELHSITTPGGAVYYGHDGVRRLHQDLEDAWEAIRLEAEAYFDLGEHTVLFGVFHGRGRQSGAEVAMPAAMVTRWRDGSLIYIRGYAQRDDALRDLGVSEDVLEPIAP